MADLVPTGQATGNQLPLVSQLILEREEHFLFGGSPLGRVDVAVEVVVVPE